MMPVLYLNEAEENVLRAFALGKSNHEVHATGNVPLVGIWVFSTEICRKTGIHRLSDTAECCRYLERYEAAIHAAVPLTEDQKRILFYIDDKNTYDGIAYRLGKDINETANALEEACKQMGIFTRDERARRLQFKLYLTAFHPRPALDVFEEPILRKWAEGVPLEQIAQDFRFTIENVKAIIHRAAHKLQLNTRGRGTQRNLVHSYFRFMDWKNARETPVTMDDPAF